MQKVETYPPADTAQGPCLECGRQTFAWTWLDPSTVTPAGPLLICLNHAPSVVRKHLAASHS